MTDTESRIAQLAKQIIENPDVPPEFEAVCFCLCEIAQQLSRIADTLANRQTFSARG